MKTTIEVLMEFFPAELFNVDELAQISRLIPVLHAYGEAVKEECAKIAKDSIHGVRGPVGDLSQLASVLDAIESLKLP